MLLIGSFDSDHWFCAGYGYPSVTSCWADFNPQRAFRSTCSMVLLYILTEVDAKVHLRGGFPSPTRTDRGAVDGNRKSFQSFQSFGSLCQVTSARQPVRSVAARNHCSMRLIRSRQGIAGSLLGSTDRFIAERAEIAEKDARVSACSANLAVEQTASFRI